MRWYEGKILIFGNEKRTAVVEMPVDKLKSCHGIFDRVIIESVHARVSLFPRADEEIPRVHVGKSRRRWIHPREERKVEREERRKKSVATRKDVNIVYVLRLFVA